MSHDILEVCSFDLGVDYSLSVAQGIEMGHYDWVEDVVAPEYFPVETVQVPCLRRVSIFGLEQTMYSPEVIYKMGERGCRPGSTLEILNLGIRNGELQREFQIVALGAVATRNGLSRAVCLFGGETCRCVSAYLYDYLWVKSTCFMGVKIP
jgi:hypothetical protein